MKRILISALAALMLLGCKQNSYHEMNMSTLTLTQEWDKTFPKSELVNHRKITFHNRYGIELAADMYIPKEYAWGEMQLTDLWEDIEDIKDDKGTYRPHFTGTISLQKIEVPQLSKSEQALIRDGHEFYNVVDGQQRLTTISILLFEVIKMLPKNKQKELIAQYLYKNQKPRVYRFSYSGKSNNNNLYLKKEIFEDANVGSAAALILE